MPIIDESYLDDLREHLKSQEVQRQSEADDSRRKAFDKICRLVQVRDRSETELRKRLMQDSFDEVAIEEGVERARVCGLVDDLRFADMLIRSRVRVNKGKQGIEAELRRHDIEPSQVPGWPEEYYPSEEGELEQAIAFLTTKPPRSKNVRDGAYRKLMAKGYDSSLAVRAARLWSESLD